MWIHHNGILHGLESVVSKEKDRIIQRDVGQLYNELCHRHLLPWGRQLLRSILASLHKKDVAYLEECILHAKAALQGY